MIVLLTGASTASPSAALVSPELASTQARVVANASQFTAGNLISDDVFTDRSTMSENDIQAFLNSKVRSCQGGTDDWGSIVCLKDAKFSSSSRPADAYCDGYVGSTAESAARIIYRVAQSCRINPQVLLVMLQKEQGLVTHTWPSAWRYDRAMGQACPDTAPCDSQFAGFFLQMYGAARQLQLYLEGKYFTWYAPGHTWDILYNVDSQCGSSPVNIENKATSALYYYTPYQPNAASLAAGDGLSADPCSSYGNRNFHNFFWSWFGNPHGLPNTGFVDVSGNPSAGIYGAGTYSAFATEIAWMSSSGISTGYGAGNGKKEYRPFGTVTRDAMAAFLYRAAGEPQFVAPTVSPFADVTPTSAFYKEITWLASTGISTGWVVGNGQKEFRPFANITRDAMAAFLFRYAESPSVTPPVSTPFRDVATGNGFYTEITWLASTGISTGWTVGAGVREFRPYSAITRDAMAAFLYRFDDIED